MAQEKYIVLLKNQEKSSLKKLEKEFSVSFFSFRKSFQRKPILRYY